MAKKTNKVKRTKGNVNLLVIVLLLVGWLCAISLLTGDKAAEEQRALVEQAKVYLEDELYILAVQKYEEAITNYATDNNLKLQEELLSIYKQAGMMNEYRELIETRIDSGVAEEKEYIENAQMYIEAQSYKKAIMILQSGIKLFDNEEMIQICEDMIYECKKKTLNTTAFLQPSEDWIIPAFNGEKWGYVATNGETLLDFKYDYTTRFCDGYAVVKLDGVYTLIDEKGYKNAIDKLGLDEVTALSSRAIVGVKNGKYRIYKKDFTELSEETYEGVYLNDNGLYVVKKNGKWAILNTNLEALTDYVYTDVVVNSAGQVFTGKYAMVRDEKGYFLVDESGNEMYAKRFVDAKGYEGGLCAVANAERKWGFADETGNIVVDYQYADANSFSDNLGAVKYAGKWGYINRYNKMMIEPKYEMAYPFVGGAAVTKTDLGNFEVLTLRYYDLF